MVINLLPWRESRNKRCRRQIVQSMLAIAVCHLLIGLTMVLAHLERSQRLLQNSTDVQAQLQRASQHQQSLEQAHAAHVASIQSLHVMLARWKQNADVQKLIRDWGGVGKTIDVSRVVWADRQMQFIGEADSAAAIRVLKNLLSGQMHNQQIELLSEGKYQFVISTEPAELVLTGGDR